MFCPNCGKDAGDASFCPECGTNIAADVIGAGKTGTASPKSVESGLGGNVAGLLCYLLGWITGLIFFLIDKRPFVRFHAMQSIVTFGSLTIINYLLGGFLSFLPYALFRMLRSLTSLVSLAGLVLWILLMVKAYQGQYYKLPVVGDYAEQWAGTSGSVKG